MTHDQGWFDENEAYHQLQASLPHYQFTRLIVEREIAGAQHLLDVGNGGFFNYNTSLCDEITAVDVFLKPGHPEPHITNITGSILSLPTSGHDVILLQHVLHHVTGRSINANHAHLRTAFVQLAGALATGGKLVIIESVVPRWFYKIECALYGTVRRLKRGGHPVTFQFTRDHLIGAGRAARLVLRECSYVPAVGSVIQAGHRWPAQLTPARAVKLIWSLDDSPRRG